MNFKMAALIKNICYTLGCAIAVVGALFFAEKQLWFFISAIVLLGVGLVVHVMFYRCPHCKKPFPRGFGVPETCPHCGEKL